MTKKKVVFIIITSVLGILLSFFAFAFVVSKMFYKIQNDPISNAAIHYIRTESKIEEEYGEIEWIGRNVVYDERENGEFIEVPFGATQKDRKLIIYVTLKKDGENYIACSAKVEEIIYSK